MPSDKKLNASRHPTPGGFLFSDHRMALKIEDFIGRQHATFFNVVAIHDDFADIVNKRRLLHKKAVVSSKIEVYSDGVRNGRDTQSVRMRVTLELIHVRGEFEQLFIKTRFSRGRALHRVIVSAFAVEVSSAILK